MDLLKFLAKTKMKFDQDFKDCWSFCFDLKVLNESKYSMSWARCAFGNVFLNKVVMFIVYTHKHKTAKHKHQSARRLQWISFLFSKVGIDCHTDHCHQDLSLLWQTQKIQTLASIYTANFAGAPASNFYRKGEGLVTKSHKNI